jgi:hypothetical protein
MAERRSHGIPIMAMRRSETAARQECRHRVIDMAEHRSRTPPGLATLRLEQLGAGASLWQGQL